MKESEIEMRNKQTIRFLNWIIQNPSWWHLICTPNDERANIQNMQTAIKKLEKESLFELIFVLLMVHRDEKIMKNLYRSMFIRMSIKELRQGHSMEEIIKYFIDYFQ